jgi:hypothetical protein
MSGPEYLSVIAVPGPSVPPVIANTLNDDARAGL